MDFLTSKGYAHLGYRVWRCKVYGMLRVVASPNTYPTSSSIGIWANYIRIGACNFIMGQSCMCMQCTAETWHLRLAMWVIMNECTDALNVIGPDCSSWGIPARSTSMRSYVNPFGRLGNDWVHRNYCLVSRIPSCNDIAYAIALVHAKRKAVSNVSEGGVAHIAHDEQACHMGARAATTVAATSTS